MLYILIKQRAGDYYVLHFTAQHHLYLIFRAKLKTFEKCSHFYIFNNAKIQTLEKKNTK